MHKIRTEIKEGSLYSVGKVGIRGLSCKNLSVSCCTTESAVSKLLRFVRCGLYFEVISSVLQFVNIVQVNNLSSLNMGWWQLHAHSRGGGTR